MQLAASQHCDAEQTARQALRSASAGSCQFLWGAVEAGHLLAQALIGQERPNDALPILNETFKRRRRIGDPRAEQTQQLLSDLDRFA